MVNQINSVHICFVSVQTGVVIVDDCEMAVAVKFGTQEGSFGCAAAAKLPQGKGFQRYGYELCVFVFEHHWVTTLWLWFFLWKYMYCIYNTRWRFRL